MSIPPIVFLEKEPKKKPYSRFWYVLVLLMLTIIAVLSMHEEDELEHLENNLAQLDFKDSLRYCQLKANSEGKAPVFCVEIIKKYRKQAFDCLDIPPISVYQKDLQKEILIGKKKYKHITFGKDMKALDSRNINKNIELIALSEDWKSIIDLIKDARYIEKQADKTGNITICYHVLENDVLCQQKKYKVKIVLKESSMGLYLYDVDLI